LLAAIAVAGAVAGACSGKKEPPVGVRDAKADSADQVMFHIKTVLTDRGLLRAQLEADTAYFFDENSRVELRRVHTLFYTAAGLKNAELTALEGTYNTRLQQTEARKNVVVVGEDGRRLTTSQLRYDQAKNQISSDSAFTLVEPTRRLEGIGFVSDPNMKNIRINQVKSGTAGRFTLPGQ
jgi:LPS export ABC transporter protein LptC